MNALLWICQAALAVAFGMAGFMKLALPIPDLAQQLVWPGDLAPSLVRFIGASELAAAVGLILPGTTPVQRRLTKLAAVGLTIVMLLAMVFHLARGEWQALPINLVLGGAAAFVAWGRSRLASGRR